MEHALFGLAVIGSATLAALLEIQIEGEEGWAASLPTWRLRWRWVRPVLGARDVTGYHVYVHLLVAMLVHLPFLLGFASFTWAGEARILAFLVLFWLVEDFLWFALNPAYGLRRFGREHIWWHAETWWIGMPRDYWIFGPVGIGLYVLGVA